MEMQSEENLRRLLRLKSCERPSEDFWESFEAEFQERRLRELVRRPPTGSIGRFLGRLLGPATAIVGTGAAALLLCLAPRADSGCSDLFHSECFQLAMSRDVDDGVCVEEDFAHAVGDVCYVSELPLGSQRPLLTAHNF